jgi:endonuclease/exonuclease/phosphatase family metal-dependent hydrolase
MVRSPEPRADRLDAVALPGPSDQKETAMPTPMRIATFNIENLDDGPAVSPPLADRIAVLQPELLRLRADVLCLQEVNGQEAPNQPRSLAALEALIHGTPYENFHVAHTKTQSGVPYDVRNLVVLSRFPILEHEQLKNSSGAPQYQKVTALPKETVARPVEWERPILRAKLDMGGGRSLHVLNVHLKSKLPTQIQGQKKDRFTWKSAAGWAEGFFISSMKRVGQALEVRLLVDQLFDVEPRAWIAVCGDFNAESDEVPTTAIRGPVEETGNPELTTRVLIPCENTIPESSRYSLFHLGKGMMLDHVLVSRGLAAFYKGAEIHNEVLPDESGAFRTDVLFPESDHAPVVAEFILP